jgi:cysteine synthase A
VSIDLDLPEFRAAHDVPKIRAALQEITGAATIPQVFIGGVWIGGSMEVMEAAESGELQRLLASNSIPFDYEGEVSRYDFLPNWVQRPQSQAA